MTRTSGDSISHHYGNRSRYVKGTAQKLVLGADIRHALGFSAPGRLGGWLSVVGPAGAILYYGAGIFVWPQEHFYHSVFNLRTTTVVELKNASVTVHTQPISIKARLIQLSQAVSKVRVGNSTICCCASRTQL